MRNLRSFLIVSILISCSEKPTGIPEVASAEEFKDIPAGAVKEEYKDAPGLAFVSLSDNAGNKTAGGNYLNGKREGSWVEYHSNGVVKSITTYVGGEKEGIAIEIGNNGQVIKRMSYHKDKRHGDYKEYNYANVKEERIYQNGKIEGLVKIFYDNGKIMEEGLYKSGLRDGISKWYDQEGNMTIEYEYKGGELIKK